MSVLPVLKFITNHPLNRNHKFRAIWRFVKWQINVRLNPYPIIYPFTEKAKLAIQRGMTGATGNLYCGLHEFDSMSFLLHFLREGDGFGDIGANVGSFTMLASAHCGATSICVEPVPTTYAGLVRNIYVNQINDKVTSYNVAMGSQEGFIDFTNSLDTMNHVAKQEGPGTFKVKVETLDGILQKRQVPNLLKIDVEGFETEVVRGASWTLQQNELKAIIIELPGVGARYGYDESKIHDTFIQAGFGAYEYFPWERRLMGIEKFGGYNTIYIRDIDFVKDRLITAPKFKVLNFEI
ncbi:MAG: FkbM family methyltransferase [Saprospiraceae bacterium]|uniref:FkbM family methyltransferase n=1 Tax=Candidatus Opimibacter skivensis TaxID=2982028 RepID=A0A9D7SZ43_9BACT|nr:FkbM family methyltransferase [Candidatus Opimibacter skivensis]